MQETVKKVITVVGGHAAANIIAKAAVLPSKEDFLELPESQAKKIIVEVGIGQMAIATGMYVLFGESTIVKNLAIGCGIAGSANVLAASLIYKGYL